MENGDLSERARRILDAARDADDPIESDRARIDAAFANRLRAIGVSAPTSVGATTGADGLRSSLRGPAHAAPSAGGAGAASKIALALLGAGIVAVGLGRLSQPDASKPAPQPLASTVAAAPAPHVPDAPAVTPPAIHELPTTPAAPAVVVQQRSTKVAHRSRSRSRGATRDQLAAAVPPTDALGDEVALLETANAALRDGRFAQALRALDVHERRYATGALREERLGLRVLALCGAGDYAAGTAARRSFLRSAPHSVLARKVAQACAPGMASEPQKLDETAD